VELKEQTHPTEPSAVIQEIRAHMEKLDLVDEIVGAVNSMRDAVGCPSCSMVATYG
jgi:hypothetical protein